MRTLRGILVTVLISTFGGCGTTSPCMDAHERLQHCIDSLHCGSMPVAACQDLQQSLGRSAKLAGECSGATLQYANELDSCELDPATCECKSILFGNACVNPGAAVTSGVSFINKSPFCATNLCMVTPPTSRAIQSSPHKSSELGAVPNSRRLPTVAGSAAELVRRGKA